MVDIEQILFFDIETTGISASLDDLKKNNPRLADLWAKRDEFLRERYSNNKGLSADELWRLKSGLQPEFGLVVCISFGYFVKKNDDYEKKITSFALTPDTTEAKILLDAKGVINNATKKGFRLGGMAIKRFDVPYLWKRMLINKINPPTILNAIGKKPWEINFIDLSDIWSGGAWQESYTSLDIMSAVFNIASPKAEMQASRVHEEFWFGTDRHIIEKYCSADVSAEMDITRQIFSILKT